MKGRQFTAEDFGDNRRRALARQRKNPEEIEQAARDWAREQNERHAVVAVDGDIKITTEELVQRTLNKLSPEARAVAGMMMRRGVSVRREIVAAFTSAGELKNPFSKPTK